MSLCNSKYKAYLGEGWKPLLEACMLELEEIGWDGEVIVAKEKFGELRLYLTKENDASDDVVRKYEKLSKITCETCGSPGSLKTLGSGWVKTLCQAHADERLQAIFKEEFKD
jgi:hypothetical protein